jgi:hypothetical protein
MFLPVFFYIRNRIRERTNGDMYITNSLVIETWGSVTDKIEVLPLGMILSHLIHLPLL